jgi:hypothetical protein
MIMTNWKIREEVGKIEKKNYGFDTFAWKHFDTGTLYVASISYWDAIDSAEINAKARSIINKICEAMDITPVTLIIKSKKPQSELSVDERDVSKIAEDLNSAWYSDELYVEAQGVDCKAIVQPEGDGADICIYISGDEAEKVFNKVHSELEKL